MWGFLTAIPGLLNGLLGYLAKRQDVDLEKFRVGTVSGKEVSIELIRGFIQSQGVAKDIILAGMNHPVWWAAWIVFVFPVGLYHASVFFVSIFDMFLNSPGCGPHTFPCEWYVKRVPIEQEEFGRQVVYAIFGGQITHGIVSSVASRWLKK
ncbi:hypothetical protein PQJ75_00575 [Rhodoplanes sp. TEM]|uniref:Uncharacterized protein n=1 Tax=Rhodoplanes tepidamans TaxID=200616 RepID=A0ABT5J5S9_RHOTP|nr:MULTISPECIES: hypothetical protein [Rhodoplanes]MDC7784746.1 hypothetical protein [Rhodoplanes tepidamans]MDC7982213.1 hypothetical protein [Rhodoplanes sp. TEM]MDQ0356218.1 hypothetical protein [Rhodoplanes tepidamans]